MPIFYFYKQFGWGTIACSSHKTHKLNRHSGIFSFRKVLTDPSCSIDILQWDWIGKIEPKTGFPCLLKSAGIFIGKFPAPQKSLKMTLVLEIARKLCRFHFWLQIDVFLQMKMAIIVATRYVFWAVGMPKMYFVAAALPWTPLGSLQRSPGSLAAVFHYI